jgi:tyrosine-specific transport protein
MVTSRAMSKSKYSPQLMSAIFLVAGTCIGGGMLALPVGCAQSGFFPSIFWMTLAWLAMTGTALCLVEVGFWMRKDDAHVISMSSAFLGKPGKMISWVLFLFISYASLIAYTGGGGNLITRSLATLFEIHISKGMGCLVFMALFGSIIFFSHKMLGRINSYLVFLMIVAYVLLVAFSIGSIQSELLFRHDFSTSFISLPLLLTAFSFQTMVPSLHPFLDHDARSLRVAIIAGTSIAFIVYLIWQLIVLGCVPLEGSMGLMGALKEGEAATHYLGHALQNPWISSVATFFAFFALVTSFLGMSLGLYDFLSDGLKIPKVGKGHLALTALVLIPTLYFAVSYERIFLAALDTSGGFGDSILNGIFPILMVWIGRYVMKKHKTAFQGLSKYLLIVMLVFYVGTLLLEVFMHTGHVQKVTDVREFDVLENEV